MKKNTSQEFRLKNIEEIKNYLINKIDENDLMSKKRKKGFTILNYTENFFILVSVITGCVSISAFASLAGIPMGITSSA